jgi:hypothetical protein
MRLRLTGMRQQRSAICGRQSVTDSWTSIARAAAKSRRERTPAATGYAPLRTAPPPDRTAPPPPVSGRPPVKTNHLQADAAATGLAKASRTAGAERPYAAQRSAAPNVRLQSSSPTVARRPTPARLRDARRTRRHVRRVADPRGGDPVEVAGAAHEVQPPSGQPGIARHSGLLPTESRAAGPRLRYAHSRPTTLIGPLGVARRGRRRAVGKAEAQPATYFSRRSLDRPASSPPRVTIKVLRVARQRRLHASALLGHRSPRSFGAEPLPRSLWAAEPPGP